MKRHIVGPAGQQLCRSRPWKQANFCSCQLYSEALPGDEQLLSSFRSQLSSKNAFIFFETLLICKFFWFNLSSAVGGCVPPPTVLAWRFGANSAGNGVARFCMDVSLPDSAQKYFEPVGNFTVYSRQMALRFVQRSWDSGGRRPGADKWPICVGTFPSLMCHTSLAQNWFLCSSDVTICENSNCGWRGFTSRSCTFRIQILQDCSLEDFRV